MGCRLEQISFVGGRNFVRKSTFPSPPTRTSMAEVAVTAPTVDDGDVSIDTPIVASHNRYLVDQTVAIREKAIPWEGYQKAGLITEEELSMIRQFEKAPSDCLNDAGEKFVDLLLTLLHKLVRNDTLQSILLLVEDKVASDSAHIELFFVGGSGAAPAYGAFVKLLKKDDEFIQLKSAKLFTTLVLQRPETPPDATDVFAWISQKVQDPNPQVVDIAVQILQSLLSVPTYRIQFYKHTSGMSAIVEALKKNSTNAQMQYQIIYCMWLMSFSEEVAADIQRRYEVLPTFIDIAKVAIKEKVVRVIFSTIRNLVSKALEANLVAMLGNKLLALCETLSARKWTDSEISEDLEFIKAELGRSVQNLTTFDEYSSEVKSGKLDWSPVHMSEQFWKKNAARLSEKDYELIRALSRLISTSTSPLILSVAAHDIGQYIKYCPSGKRFIQEHGTKTQIMELMTHENPDVRYQALLAVQTFMTNAWEYQS
ncbi:armadillo-type protein [Zopfochytrium polystomum]|nr:armadillo-type protein [Zopfochytrium polystomum]